MANPNATVHNIDLSSTVINLSKYENEIALYDGFLNQNSPYYGNVLSPFYSKGKVLDLNLKKYVLPNEDVVYLGGDGLYLHKQIRNATATKILSSSYNITYKEVKASSYAPISADRFLKMGVYTSPDLGLNKQAGSVNVWDSQDGGLTYSARLISRGLYQYLNANKNYTEMTVDDLLLYGVPYVINQDNNIRYYGGFVVHLTANTTAGTPKFRALFNNDALQGFSVALDRGSIGTLLSPMGTVDESAGYYVGGSGNQSYLYYRLLNGKWIQAIVATKTPAFMDFQIVQNRYVLTNFAEYYNAYDLLLERPFHWASDYNNRAFFVSQQIQGSSSWNNLQEDSIAVTYASGQESNLNLPNYRFPSAQFGNTLGYALPYYPNPTSAQAAKGYNIDPIIPVIQCGYTPESLQKIQCYYSPVEEGTNPLYVSSYYTSKREVNNVLLLSNGIESDYVNTRYEGQLYGIPSIFSQFNESNINKIALNDLNYGYVLINTQGNNVLFIYNYDSEVENASNSFIVQGITYIVSNNIIYRYNEDTTLEPCVNIGNMRFLGATPYQALFYSAANKSIYSFKGDNNIDLLIQSNKFSKFNCSAYNPNTLSIYVLFDNILYIFTNNNQLIKIDDGNKYTEVYPTNNGLALSYESTYVIFLQYNYDSTSIGLLGAKRINLRTMFYGRGDGIVSVNDCVYLRLYRDTSSDSNLASTGSVKITSYTMRQGVIQSASKTFNITADMWDSTSNTLLLRYQPQYQEAEGFSVEIDSYYPIAELKISETPIARVNSKYNI